MAKGTPFTEQDLLARGFRNNGSGIFSFVGKALGDTFKASSEFDKQVKKLPPVLPALPKKRPAGLVAIENVLMAARIEFVNEYVFSETRMFRFDIAVPSMKLAIEYEGIFSKDNGQNGHTGVKHYVKDCQKYNLATVEGWKVLRYTAKNYKHFIDDLKQLITIK